ncbi:hypothetical protein SAMN04489761_1999 [Tenacibaculum sp. MAR_2009_124]|uniref:hypothetical protein n=1 Tax=Tenacibaculum sp. MAR_2009_124 TaxID=1250059 RepID=UPI000898D2B3|nr:hypothetical protein [Tenacibaculum sp. MAR_2009_124]SEB86701.1 hypothetical protein SAMN04489761_1999 [Tenacibaculum sp. MAR_2009_124]
MKQIQIFLIVLILWSCKTDKKENRINNSRSILEIKKIENNSAELKNINSINKHEYKDTILIDYPANRKLLEILKVLPKEAMASWEWTAEERLKTVQFIEKNNFLIDSTEMYNNIKYIKPNTLGIQVVDGFWTLSVLELNSGKNIVITNDIVGDGNDINTFIYDGNNLDKIEFEKLFGKGIDYLLKKQSEECLLEMEDYFLTFDYDFSDSNVVKITSWGIDKTESINCFKGNTIEFKLNKSKEIYELKKIYWHEN